MLHPPDSSSPTLRFSKWACVEAWGFEPQLDAYPSYTEHPHLISCMLDSMTIRTQNHAFVKFCFCSFKTPISKRNPLRVFTFNMVEFQGGWMFVITTPNTLTTFVLQTSETIRSAANSCAFRVTGFTKVFGFSSFPSVHCVIRVRFPTGVT